MLQQKKGERRWPSALGVVLVLFLGLIAYNALFSFSYTVGPNYRNVSVDTRLNITNSVPEILSVTITDPITLNAGSTVGITCNASIRDYNGGDTIVNVSAIFFDSNNATIASPDDNNNHYTNDTCTNTSVNGFIANFTCGFDVWYYANNGSNWVCNVTVVDSFNFSGNVSGNDTATNTTTINSLLALNISTQLINYGNLSIGDTSTPQEANVTNFGNVDINISVKGYGASEDDGLAFVCSVGNITISNERFSLNQSGDFNADYTALNETFQQVTNLTIIHQTNDSQQEINSTYWRVYVPPNPFGVCNGTVVFQAESAT